MKFYCVIFALLMASQAYAMGAGREVEMPQSDLSPMVAASVETACGDGVHFSLPTVSPQWAAVQRDGKPIDVVQFYVHGSLESLKAIFYQEGWDEAMRANVKDDLAYFGSVLIHFEGLIQRMPVSDETLCGHEMVTAFEQGNKALSGRRHFRVFTAGQDNQGRDVWAISASLDTGIRFDEARPNQLFLNHKSEENEDLERDRVLQEFFDQNAVASINTLTLAPTGYAQDNHAYSADGKVYDLVLRE